MQLEWDEDGDFIDHTLSIKQWAVLLLRQAPALFRDQPLPRAPIPVPLTTEERIRIFRQRIRAGTHWHHPDDATPAEMIEGFDWGADPLAALRRHLEGRHV
jgi:hypothetical protein